MPSNRLAARLGQLPHTVLADLAARLCSESPAQQAAAEECMAAHNPLPHEMVERVLLSPDLVPHILGPGQDVALQGQDKYPPSPERVGVLDMFLSTVSR